MVDKIYISRIYTCCCALIHNPLLLHPWMVVDPRSGAQTQQIESLWRALKRRMSRGGVPKNEEASGMHFGEFLWFRKYKADPFVNLICDISRVYIV